MLNERLGVNRKTSEPGGCECQECGAIFIGGETDTICGICFAAYEESLRKEYQASAKKEMQRAAWQEEMRRDAFDA